MLSLHFDKKMVLASISEMYVVPSSQSLYRLFNLIPIQRFE